MAKLKKPALASSLKISFLTLGAAVTLTGCDDESRGKPPLIDNYSSLQECVDAGHSSSWALSCRMAYKKKLDGREVKTKLYKTPEECIEDNPDKEVQCMNDWEKSLAEAKKSAPTYQSQASCETEYASCEKSSDTGFFMPMMAGYMMGSLMNSGRSTIVQPIYESHDRAHYRTSRGLSLAKNKRYYNTSFGSLTSGKVHSAAAVAKAKRRAAAKAKLARAQAAAAKKRKAAVVHNKYAKKTTVKKKTYGSFGRAKSRSSWGSSFSRSRSSFRSGGFRG